MNILYIRKVERRVPNAQNQIVTPGAKFGFRHPLDNRMLVKVNVNIIL